MKEVLRRYSNNPIIDIDDIPGGNARSVFNPGAVKFNGKYILLMTVRSMDNLPKYGLATSDDGYKFSIAEKPLSLPEDEEYSKYEFCNYDPRITKLGDFYCLTYAISGFLGCRIGIMRTKDFVNFERVSFVHEVGNHNVALFPEKINGLYACLDRPQSDLSKNMWISYSPDLVFWGKSKSLLEARPGFWDGSKVGAGPPPIKTPRGWLIIYHGVNDTVTGPIYQLGCAILDLEDPSRILARKKDPILFPKELHEQVGFISNVVFSNGAILDEESGELKIYYGACDQCICLATVNIKELVDSCFE
jgi:beta-1,4-mannooligosaccharide/beta-1,4-mannosyl-N-acetylglucosamine phosphorylase